MLTLISATPSPYARKNRIALLEKNVPFTLRSEIPWHHGTETPQHNPLEKLPILLFDDGRPPIYESWYIQEYIVQKYAGVGPRLMPEGVDEALAARRVQVVADGGCDAMGLAFFETSRGALKSDEWMARQLRKVHGAIKAIDAFVKARTSDFLIGDELSVADIAAGAMLGMMDMVETQFGLIRWKEDYPELLAWWERLEERESFRQTRPVMFELTEKVV
ncbi:MAG: hypothetical protein ASARMPREDX12_001725 [Alectoria sarmentosa]|nr:MAG: hypothetical protein ASARMPREDX12_001725 [Alectoria sarmentosa]